MKRILFVTSQYRAGERIYPTIPHLAKEYNLDLLKVYQMLPSHVWVGDLDMRNLFLREYSKYFQNIYEGYVDPRTYDLILTDDNRLSEKTKLYNLYSNKNVNTKMISCVHGNGGFKKVTQSYNLVFDKCLTFGKYDTIHKSSIPTGIPANDKLFEYKDLEKKHILIIVNFLGNRQCPYKVKFDSKLFNDEKIKALQTHFNLPIVIKLKSRADEGGFSHNLKYIKNIINSDIDYNVIVDVEDDNKLIAESVCVISAPSTLSLKSIQLGIPTILIKDSGELGSFENYDGFFSINDDFLGYVYSYERKVDFIENTIEGGLTFNSTQVFLDTIKKHI